MSRYSEGVRVEHLVMDDLRANGYLCTRAASSKGVSDVIAVAAGEVLFVSCKRTTMPGPAERIALLDLRRLLPGVAVPLVALKPLRQPIQYRCLLGPGAREWSAWSPDYAVTP